MSNAPLPSGRTALDDESTTTAYRAWQALIDQTRAVGFWSAIALPFLYVPVLATGLETVTETSAVLVLLSLNLLAVLLGRSYDAN